MYAGRPFAPQAVPQIAAPATTPTETTVAWTGIERPTKAVGTGTRLIDDTQADGSNGIFRVDGKKVVFGLGDKGDFAITYDIVRCDPPGPKARLELVCVDINKPAEAFTSNKVGDKLEGVWSVSGRLLRLRDESKNVTMLALRPHAGIKLPSKTVPSAEGNDAALVGDWIGLNEVGLLLDDEKIGLGTEQWGAETYKIITWENTPSFAKVEAICNGLNGAGDRRSIGKRFKLLVARDAAGNTRITHNTFASGKHNEWPAGFDTKYLTADPPGSVAPIAGQRTIVIEKGKP
jgi:hypothetical protein